MKYCAAIAVAIAIEIGKRILPHGSAIQPSDGNMAFEESSFIPLRTQCPTLTYLHYSESAQCFHV